MVSIRNTLKVVFIFGSYAWACHPNCAQIVNGCQCIPDEAGGASLSMTDCLATGSKYKII